MDISTLGPLFYLVFALPGFVGVSTLRILFNARRPLNGWAWTCCSALYGIIIFGAWEWSVKNNIQQIDGLVANPLAAAIFLSIFAVILSSVIRVVILLMKYLGLGILALFVLLVGVWDWWREERRRDKIIEKYKDQNRK